MLSLKNFGPIIRANRILEIGGMMPLQGMRLLSANWIVGTSYLFRRHGSRVAAQGPLFTFSSVA